MSSTDGHRKHTQRSEPMPAAASAAQRRRPRDGAPRTKAVAPHPASAEVESLTREVMQLQAVTDTALAQLALPDLLRELLERIQSLMVVDDAAILLVEEDTQQLLLTAAHGPDEPEVGQLRIPVGQGVTGRVAATRAPMVVDDLASVEVVYPRVREVYRSAVGVPMLVEQRLVGVVCVSSTVPRHFTGAEVQLLQKAADRMALAVDRARLYSAQQQAREQAEQQTDQLNRIFEGIADGLVVYNAEGQPVRLNAAARRILGLDAAPSDYSHLPAPDRAILYEALDEHGHRLNPDDWPLIRVLRGEVTGADTREVQLRMLDGREVEVITSAAPLLDRNGHLVGAVTILHDQTDGKQLAREREKAHARELAAEQVAEQMGAFLATAAHDIRQPLTVASARVQMAGRLVERLAAALRDRPPTLSPTTESPTFLVDEVVESLQRAQVGMQTLRRLVNVLFDVTRAQAQQLTLELAPIDLRALVEETVAAQQVATHGHRLLLVTLPSQAVWVEGDTDRLDEVLTNFLTNALKYSPALQPVTIRLEVVERQAVVSVTDHGPGIASEEQGHIWDMFYRSPAIRLQPGNRAEKGSLGLGLHICKQLAELHPGGRIGVESQLGKGSTFWFQLPLVP